jgi:hypothetical protein
VMLRLEKAELNCCSAARIPVAPVISNCWLTEVSC